MEPAGGDSGYFGIGKLGQGGSSQLVGVVFQAFAGSFEKSQQIFFLCFQDRFFKALASAFDLGEGHFAAVL